MTRQDRTQNDFWNMRRKETSASPLPIVASVEISDVRVITGDGRPPIAAIAIAMGAMTHTLWIHLSEVTESTIRDLWKLVEVALRSFNWVGCDLRRAELGRVTFRVYPPKASTCAGAKRATNYGAFRDVALGVALGSWEMVGLVMSDFESTAEDHSIDWTPLMGTVEEHPLIGFGVGIIPMAISLDYRLLADAPSLDLLVPMEGRIAYPQDNA